MSFACALLGSRRARLAVSLVRATERTQGISRNQLLSDPSPEILGRRSYCPRVPHGHEPEEFPRPRPAPLAVTGPECPPVGPVGRQTQGFPKVAWTLRNHRLKKAWRTNR